MSRTVTCSSCSGTDDLAVVQAGGDRNFIGPLRLLLYCSSCGSNPDRCAHWREAVDLKLVTEQLLVEWYLDGKTESDPEFACFIVFGEYREFFVTEATKILEARAAEAK